MGLRRLKRVPLEQLQPFLLALPDAGAVFDWSAIFGNKNPVELEVGFGKGGFLVAAAQARPNVNFVGIEIERALVLYVAGRMVRRKLSNVRLLHGDARQIVARHLPADSLQAIHVYFPDPWWKRRHRKRRLFTAEFAHACVRALQPGGRLHLATDVEEYFTEMLTILHAIPELKVLEQGPWEAACQASLDVITNFQRKALQQGRSIWRAVFEKVSPSTESGELQSK